MPTIVGVISDTHGLLRPEAVEALRGSALIIHAGDIGAPGILDELARIAPVHAVRGNVDLEKWAHKLPLTRVVEVEDALIYVLHDVHTLDLKPQFHAVVYGHSHRPEVEWRGGVLYFNPGAAGPRRFHLPVSVGRLLVDGSSIEGVTIEV